MTAISTRVLLVDDHAYLLGLMQQRLSRLFDVDTALGAEQGLEKIQQGGPCAVIVSDYEMPGMNGVELLARVHAISPETIALMFTGHVELDVALQALHKGGVFRFLSKSGPSELLVTAIRDALEQHRLVMSERVLKEQINDANQSLRKLNERLKQQVQERTAAVRSLYRFVSELNGLDRMEDIGRLVIARTAEMLDSRRAALLLPDVEGHDLRVFAEMGVDKHVRESICVPRGVPVAGKVWALSACIVLNEADTGDAFGHPSNRQIFGQPPLACAALVTPRGPVGVLCVSEPEGGKLYSEDETAATLEAIAEASAMAVLNQLRRDERNEARDAVILALAKLAEHRDPETGAHLERVQSYCRLLAETLALQPQYAAIIDGQFVDNIFRSSPLHDIGKVGIPDRILCKPGRLTPEEFEIMKRHSAIGGDTIRSLISRQRSRGFLQMGMDIAYAHHEKFDGSGYPRGLAGQAIPLPARILALADVYDALTSKRVYKPALPHEQAVEIIKADSGTHFDPDVVAAFLEKVDEFADIRMRLVDSTIAIDQPALAGAKPEGRSLPLAGVAAVAS